MLDLIERHGLEGAHAEALRLADVALRIRSDRNRAIYRRAARRLADDRGTIATEVRMSPMGRFRELVAEFAAPRIPLT